MAIQFFIKKAEETVEPYPTYTFYNWGRNLGSRFTGSSFPATLPIPDTIVTDPLDPYTDYWICRGAFARRESGTYICAGSNDYGQLGLGHTGISLSPVSFTPPPGLGQIKYVIAGGRYAESNYMLFDTGELFVAGRNHYGQLGLGDTTQRESWTQVPFLLFRDVFTSGADNNTKSYRVAGVTLGGQLYMWGNSSSSHDIPGYTTTQNSPVLITVHPTDPIEVKYVAVNELGNLVMSVDNRFFGNGSSQQNGLNFIRYNTLQEGIPDFIGQFPDDVVTQIVNGANHGLCILSNGTAWSYGNAGYSQPGLGYLISATKFTRIGGMDTDWSGVAAGIECTFLQKTDGSIFVCGRNRYGQLSSDYTENSTIHTLSPITGWNYQFPLIESRYHMFGGRIPL